jgi:RNA polymerase sigma-70 factor (ECF subfamily)
MSVMAVAPEASRVDLAADASETAEQLFQEHARWIYGYCLRLLRSPEEAEDALQTTYLNACRSLGSGTRPHVGSAWLLRIAQNVCFARLRSSGRRGRLESLQDTSFLEETVAAPERSPDELIGLTDALCSIPERQREAILLREWQGLSYSEVGAHLGLSQSAVETLIFRARRSLAGALEDPGKRGRRRKALHAFDLAGLAAALKGLFAGASGVKAVAVLTVAAATTATVVATDPVGVWRDKPPAVAEQASGPERAGTAVPSPSSSSQNAADLDGTAAVPFVPVWGPLPTTGERRGTEGAPGLETSEQAKGQGNGKAKAHGAGGNGKGKALGLAKEPVLPPTAQGTPAGGQPDEASEGQDAPPPVSPPASPPETRGKSAEAPGSSKA